jgi:PilZ domain
MMQLPEITAEVTLAVPRRERVPASVAHTGDGWLDLLLQATPSTPSSLLAQGGLFVEFVNDEGLCRLHARKDRAAAEPPGGYGVHDVMRLTHDGAVQLLQARAFIRADVSAEIVLRHALTGQLQRTSTLDISGGGALLTSIAGAREGDSFDFEIEMPEHEPPVTGRLRVVRFTGALHAGVQFTEIAEAEQGRLVRHVVNVQTAAREARRGGA